MILYRYNIHAYKKRVPMRTCGVQQKLFVDCTYTLYRTRCIFMASVVAHTMAARSTPWVGSGSGHRVVIYTNIIYVQ